MKNYKEIKKQVQLLLTEREYLRDDKILTSWLIVEKYIYITVLKDNIDLTIHKMLTYLKYDKTVPKFETIYRAWRQVQNENVELRGKEYNKRQTHATNIRKTINL